MREQKSNQRGISLMEIAIAMVLLAVLTSGIAWYASDTQDKVSLRNDARHFALVAQAAGQYIRANRSKLLSGPPLSGSLPTGPQKIGEVTARQLQDAGFLPAGMDLTLKTDAAEQPMTLLIRALPRGIAPDVRWELQGLLISHGGEDYTDSELGQMVAMAGAVAGFMHTGKTDIDGSNGSWLSKKSDWVGLGFSQLPSPGHMAALVTAGLKGTSSVLANQDVLHRVPVLGQPTLNQMTVALDMANNDITNVKEIELKEVKTNIIKSDADLNLKVVNKFHAQVGAAEMTLEGTGRFLVKNDEFSVVTALNQSLFKADKNSIHIGDAMHKIPVKIDGELTVDKLHDLSDGRLKKDKHIISGALENITHLNGYRFVWKRDNKKDIGLIAQEVREVFPELVHQDEKGFLSVAYANMVAPLIEAVKELHQLMLSLQDKLQSLFNTQNQQQAEIERLNAELKQQKRALILLKQTLKQPLSTEERTLCGAPCME